jgi:septal ring factor EnvC (AmiA/AmiB activator)
LPESSKYEILLAELSSIESELVTLSDMYKDLQLKNRELEKQVSELQKDNAVLQIKLQGSEKEKPKGELEFDFSNKLGSKERESLKARLIEMVNRIDYHLST